MQAVLWWEEVSEDEVSVTGVWRQNVWIRLKDLSPGRVLQSGGNF